MALRWWGMGSGTLLGPEGSAVRLLLGDSSSVRGVVGVSCPPFVLHLRGAGCPGFVLGVLVVGVGCWWGCCLRSA
jgi:hypothetical protein